MDVFELTNLVPNNLPDMMQLKKTIIALLSTYFDRNEKMSKKMGFGPILKSIISRTSGNQSIQSSCFKKSSNKKIYHKRNHSSFKSEY